MVMFKISEFFFLLIFCRKSVEYTFTNNDGVTISYSISFKQPCRGEQDRVGTVQGIALPECAKECSLRAYCKVLSFNRRFNMCHFYSSDTNNGEPFNKGSCVEIKASDIQLVTQPSCPNCQDNKVCDSSEQTCKYRECVDNIDNVTPLNGMILGNLNGVGNYKQYTCDFGYREVTGAEYAVCLANGNWNVTAVECEKIPESNVAKFKQTMMSSLYGDGSSERGVDGNTYQYYASGTCFHTLSEKEPWWRVDLGAIFGIFSVKRYNRLDNCPSIGGCSGRANDLRLTMGTSLQSMETVGSVPGQIADIQTFSFPSAIEARYVQVTLTGFKTLHLCEVEVFGFPII